MVKINSKNGGYNTTLIQTPNMTYSLGIPKPSGNTKIVSEENNNISDIIRTGVKSPVTKGGSKKKPLDKKKKEHKGGSYTTDEEGNNMSQLMEMNDNFTGMNNSLNNGKIISKIPEKPMDKMMGGSKLKIKEMKKKNSKHTIKKEKKQKGGNFAGNMDIAQFARIDDSVDFSLMQNNLIDSESLNLEETVSYTNEVISPLQNSLPFADGLFQETQMGGGLHPNKKNHLEKVIKKIDLIIYDKKKDDNKKLTDIKKIILKLKNEKKGGYVGEDPMNNLAKVSGNTIKEPNCGYVVEDPMVYLAKVSGNTIKDPNWGPPINESIYPPNNQELLISNMIGAGKNQKKHKKHKKH